MARTVKPKAKPKNLPTIVKAIEYNGGTIAKMSDGTIKAEYIWDSLTDDDFTEYEKVCKNRSEAEAFIDETISIIHEEIKKDCERREIKKSIRTKGGIKTKTESGKTPSGPHAGYMKNPPEDCKFAVKDQFKEIWVDVYFCAYKCDKRVDCKVAALLQEGRKERIRHDS